MFASHVDAIIAFRKFKPDYCLVLSMIHAVLGIRLIHEFSRVRQPLHCDVIVDKQ